MGVRLAPLNVLSLVPAEGRPYSFFFREALLTVREQAPVVMAPLSDSEDSSVWVRASDDLSAVDPVRPWVD